MNAQTPGPLSISGIGGDTAIMAKSSRWGGRTGAVIVANLARHRSGSCDHVCPDAIQDANSALLAAAYTAFDRAGRELGIDATELAKSLDVAALVKYAAGQVVTAGDLHARKALEGLWAAITQTPVGA